MAKKKTAPPFPGLSTGPGFDPNVGLYNAPDGIADSWPGLGAPTTGAPGQSARDLLRYQR